MQAHKGISIVPMPARRVPPIHDRESCVGFAKHRIDEGQCGGASALYQIIRVHHVQYSYLLIKAWGISAARARAYSAPKSDVHGQWRLTPWTNYSDQPALRSPSSMCSKSSNPNHGGR